MLDVGCGPGSLLDDLPAGVEYVGFDINAAYIDMARQWYGGRGTFFCAAVNGDSAPAGGASFDFVVIKSVLHHLGDEDAQRLVATVRGLLRPGGVLVSSDNVFYEGQPWISKALTALDRGGAVRTPEGYRRLLAPHFAEIETWLVTDTLPIPYAHFIMRARSRE